MGWTKQGSHPAWGKRFFLLQSAQTDCGANPVSYTMVPDALYLGVKSLGCETDHSPAPSAQVRNKCCYTPNSSLEGGPGQLSQYSDSLRAGRSWNRNPVKVRFSTPVQTALGHTQPPLQLVPSLFPGGIKRPGCGVDYPPSYRAEVKESRAMPLFLTGPSWLWTLPI
jgi:hypothetical protein